MPNLKEMLEKAKIEQAPRKSSKIIKGIRPDMMIAGVNHAIETEDKVETRSDQTRNKLETNTSQQVFAKTRDKVETQLETKQRQTEDELETNWGQKRNKISKTRDKVETQPETKLETKQRQTEDELETKVGVSGLVGLKRKLTLFFYGECRLNRSSETSPLAIEYVAKRCETSSSSVKKTIQRLESEGFLTRPKFKNGRGGWTIYALQNETFRELLHSETEDKLKTNLGQSRVKVESQLGTQPETRPSSSSRDLLIKESTTTQLTQVDISSDLTSLELGSLREFGITIETFKRAVQLHPGVSIDALHDLVFRLSELFKDPKERQRVQNARGFVIRLVEQVAAGITPLDHIDTPNDRLMRFYGQLAVQKREELRKIEDAMLQDAFEEWDRATKEEEKLQSVPHAKTAPEGMIRSTVFREYFREKLWPEKKKILLEEANLESAR